MERWRAIRLGHIGYRVGKLLGACELRRIPLPRTRMNKGKKRKAGDSRGGPQHIMESDFA